MNNSESAHLKLAHKLAEKFSALDCVVGIVVSGSLMGGAADQDSDIDLYVFTTDLIPLAVRQGIVAEFGASRADMNLQFWDLGDEWLDAATGIEVDVMYWDTAWIEGQLDRVLVEHQASVGYSTCHWGTIKNSFVLFDRDGWLQILKDKSQVAYPEELRRAIVDKNYPILRDVIPAYLHQIEKAIQRNDLVSVNHRVAALLASYFDILFALNRIPNPGEKRLLDKATKLCEQFPADMIEQVNVILKTTSLANDDLIDHIHALVDGLDELLKEEGLLA